MKKKRHSPGPVPPKNRPNVGPGAPPPPADEPEKAAKADGGADFSEQDPQRRLGHFETAGEHATVQPGGRHGGRRDV